MSTQHHSPLRDRTTDSRFARDGLERDAPPSNSPRSTRATAALVLAVAGIALAFIVAAVGLAVSVLATALALPARTSTVSRDRPGRTQAKAALYLGLAGVVLGALVLLGRAMF